MSDPVNLQELAWLCGLLEGEGSFYSSKTIPYIGMAMSDLDIMEKVASLLETNISTQIYENPNHKPMFSITICGYKAVRIMDLILPYMGKRRTEAIKQAISIWNSKSRTKERGTGPRIPECHPENPYGARGLCSSCHQKLKRSTKKGEIIELELA